MANKLKELHQQRGVIKASLTRFQTYLSDVETKKTLFNLYQIKIRKSKLEESWHQFNAIQTEIELLEEDVESSNERVLFEESFYDVIGRTDKLIDSNHAPALKSSNSSTDDSISFNSQIRLPKIDLPKFSGKYDEWFSFHDTFDTLIHSNAAISDIQKFHYLKSALRGEAAEILQSLETSNENYQTAWLLLTTRYENKRIIVQKHINAIFNLPAITKEDVRGLRQITDGIQKHIRALNSLHRPTDSWDDLVIHIIASKIDNNTNKEWESSLAQKDIPTLKQLLDFLEHKCQILEIMSTSEYHHSSAQKTQHKKYSTSHVSAQAKRTCSICKADHLIYYCNKFTNLSIKDRIREAKQHNLCINCLRPGHILKQCNSSNCKKCGKKHNTLLHEEQHSNSSENVHVKFDESAATTSAASFHSSFNCTSQILLSTAIVTVFDSKGREHPCRILLDSGSQSNFVTRALADRLGLRKIKSSIAILGINEAHTQSKFILETKIKSRLNAFQRTLKFIILDCITKPLPSITFNKSDISIPNGIKLADPDFNIANDIDMLIGVEVFYELLCIGQIKTSRTQPIFQKTQLGWIISGSLNNTPSSKQITYCNASMCELNNTLNKFWEIEEVNSTRKFNPEEQLCENHFHSTYKRNSEGRFVVQLPLKPNMLQQLGESRDRALKRFLYLEKRLDRDSQLKQDYSSFMDEYIKLGHMQLISQEKEESSTINFYLPHHAVVKQTSLTTKLRVVFDGSAKTTTNISLNDTQMTGPVLQQELLQIIIRFRLHCYVLSADITKMYRQVLIDESQRPLQRILWRQNKNEDIQTYELSTVTYGTTSASFLAIRALQQLAFDEDKNYPLGSKIATRDFYVDDLITGADTIEEAADIQLQIHNMLMRGGFELRKWASNCEQLLKNIPSNSCEHAVINLNKDEGLKMLGLQWLPESDVLSFSVPVQDQTTKVTKRSIISKIAQIFDPLGLIGPVIITSKILMQKLWQLKISWDESVPVETHSTWTQYESKLRNLNELCIPRCVILHDHMHRVQFHGFCDASEAAYGACIYVRTIHSDNKYTSRLLCAKSRVAPLKSISLPKLELCGALLLAQLMKKVTEAAEIPTSEMYYWTDSTIVLAWILAESRNWKTFVSNRVSEIQSTSNIRDWRHVGTKDNPADIISRGIAPSEIKLNSQWWHGPSWLLDSEDNWPSTTRIMPNEIIPETRTTLTTITATKGECDLINRWSSFDKLLRMTAYLHRFKYNTMQCAKGLPENKLQGALSTAEINDAEIILIRIVQQTAFQRELNSLEKGDTIYSKSSLLSLNPFLDKNGIIRVGGRLRNANIPYDAKHPIILPSHSFTKLLIQKIHADQLHAGLQSTLAAVRTKYWILRARSTIRQIIRKCVRCFRAKPIAERHIMGDLPTNRLSISRPFTVSGVDYFGPISIRETKRRNSKITKVYGAIFICFATKAVHIELVNDLTSESFIAALQRFIARRGKPAKIYSDNGTNFVGANRELKELHKLFLEENRDKLLNKMASERIEWHFIPPRSPHFGGLWEAAVKSTKTHLRKIIGVNSLTADELYTLLLQVESILNSRPLTPISDDPNDFSYLAPSHFLIGDSLISPPQPDLSNVPVNRLSRWQYIEQLKQHFWRRWYKEYLHQLQQRNKWKSATPTQLSIGRLVVLREENIPPLCWSMGRIEGLHPGSDNVTRVVTVRTANGLFTRAVNKLCVLPIEDNTSVC